MKDLKMLKPETITAKQLRPNLSHILDKVEYDKIPHIITRHGEPIANLTPIEKKA